MKKILLTSRSLENFNETYSSFDMNWFSYLKNTKITLVPNIPSRLNDYLDTSQFSGVILTGGGDIKENKLSNNNHDVYREQVEEQLIKYSIQNNIPLICVCRGMQKAVTFLEKNVKFVHNPINIKDSYELSNLDNSQLLFEGLRTCYNKYSISYDKKFEKSWNILCIDKNKNILAIRHKEHKILSLMWHPERDSSDFELINSFLK
jgi:N5-(cytidine 5'-diphosphoramidyl)-L-glutamine hydrolase